MKAITLALMCIFVLIGCTPTYGYGARDVMDREREAWHAHWERPTNHMLR